MDIDKPELTSLFTCRACKKEVYCTFFPSNGGGKRKTKCKECLKTDTRRMYVKHRDNRLKKSAEDRLYLRAKIDKIKNASCCSDCKLSFDPCAMDFDHILGKHKNISVMIGSHYPMNKILYEIAKCELVCANCHRLRTFSRIKHKAIWDSNKPEQIIRRRNARDYLNSLKQKSPCMDCLHMYAPQQMDYDHRKGEIKYFNVSKLISYGTIKKINEEVAKCDLVCVNCHRLRTKTRTDLEGAFSQKRPHPKKFPAIPVEEYNKVVSMYDEGKNISEISKIYMVSPTTIKKALVTNKVRIKTISEVKRMYSKKDETEVVSSYVGGVSVRQIQKNLTISEGAVYKILKDSKVRVRVSQYPIRDNLGNIYCSIVDASRKLKINRLIIGFIVNGKKEEINGYRFYRL